MWRPLIIVFVLCIFSAAQTNSLARPPKAAIRVLGGKRTIQWNESLRLPVALLNEGPDAFYVAKSFTEAGGGIAGFYYEIHQLTGKKTGGCGHAEDGPWKDDRPAEQVLKEDYIYLPPGAFVGFELSPMTCELDNPGKYRIEIFYSAQDLNVSRVAKLENLKAPVLVGSTPRVVVEVEVAAPLGGNQQRP